MPRERSGSPAYGRLIALDGHDGSGKTTLALALADRLGAAYVRPYIEPHGPEMLAAAERGEHERALQIARAAVARIVECHSGGVVVCDRLWVTLFTLVPEHMFSDWELRPPTAVCWADLPVTLERLASRPERAEAVAWHARYLRRYRELAERFGCPVVRTDMLSREDALDELTAWALSLGAAGGGEA